MSIKMKNCSEGDQRDTAAKCSMWSLIESSMGAKHKGHYKGKQKNFEYVIHIR